MNIYLLKNIDVFTEHCCTSRQELVDYAKDYIKSIYNYDGDMLILSEFSSINKSFTLCLRGDETITFNFTFTEVKPFKPNSYINEI